MENDNTLNISDHNSPEEIRVIGDKKYRVIKTPCTCICHREGMMVMHIMACCDDGYKSRLELIKE